MRVGVGVLGRWRLQRQLRRRPDASVEVHGERNTDTYPYNDADCYCNGNAYSDSYAYCDSNGYTYSDTKTFTDAEAAPNSAAAPVASPIHIGN